jgi:hypothetical protein
MASLREKASGGALGKKATVKVIVGKAGTATPTASAAKPAPTKGTVPEYERQRQAIIDKAAADKLAKEKAASPTGIPSGGMTLTPAKRSTEEELRVAKTPSASMGGSRVNSKLMNSARPLGTQRTFK